MLPGQKNHEAGRKIMGFYKTQNLLITLALILLPGVSPAAEAGIGQSLVQLWPVFTSAASTCSAYPISPATLAAIALVESGLDYRLVRVEAGSTVPALENSPCLVRSRSLSHGKRREYVLSIDSAQEFRQIKPLLLKSAGFDAGLMQVNSWWVNRLGLSLSDLVLSPEDNARIGCMILAEALSRSGSLVDALEIYHHGHVGDGRYAERVTGALKRLVNALNELESSAGREA